MIDKIAEVSKPNAKEKLLYYTNVLYHDVLSTIQNSTRFLNYESYFN